jgi:predicted RNA binding protein YcfA (HicA-like mRNA interferase family)
MGIIPIIKASRLIPILLKFGFRIVRQAGSHVQLEHFFDKTRKLTVPMHSKDLSIKTITSILKQAKISLGDFLKMLGRK